MSELTNEEKAEIREEIMREEAFDNIRDKAEEAYREEQEEMARIDILEAMYGEKENEN